MSRVVQNIHKYGAKAAMQLQHAGGAAHKSTAGGVQPVAASAIAKVPDMQHSTYDVPRELTISEIADIVARFVKGAERAQKSQIPFVFLDQRLQGVPDYLADHVVAVRAGEQDADGLKLRDHVALVRTNNRKSATMHVSPRP
jgi:2,4-dienoyl-CoA reductase-like NADH-dependent reductase (Old Yellow Enzyme family)